MTSPAAWLRERGLAPKKRLGQNFLLDEHACVRIAEAATTPEGGTVLEIGPGLGALTLPLLRRAARVIALERDADLVPLLEERASERAQGAPRDRGPDAAAPTSTLQVLTGDALEADWGALLEGPRPHTIAGNLPYLITGRLLERSIELAWRIDRAVFMVQAEVADRLLAAPGTKAYGALTVFTRAAFEVRKLLTLKGGAFYPRPEVSSSVVVLVPRRPAITEETPAFRALVKGAFGTRRKTLRNAWKGIFAWSPEELTRHAADAGIDLDARGETLSPETFAKLAAIADAIVPARLGITPDAPQVAEDEP